MVSIRETWFLTTVKHWISSHSFSPPFLTTTIFSYISLTLFFFLSVCCRKCSEKRWVRHEKGSRVWGVPWWVPGLPSDRPVPGVLQSLCGSQPCHQFGLNDWQHRHPRLVSLGHHLFTPSRHLLFWHLYKCIWILTLVCRIKRVCLPHGQERCR